MMDMFGYPQLLLGVDKLIKASHGDMQATNVSIQGLHLKSFAFLPGDLDFLLVPLHIIFTMNTTHIIFFCRRIFLR